MDKKELKKYKTPNILEIAATDKENLTSKVHKKNVNLNSPKASHAKKSKKIIDLDNKVTTLAKNKNNKNKKDKSTQFVPVLNSDLTNDSPSENYWKNLAESCRLALDTALKENVDLNNKVNELEYENSRLKAMLDEAKSLVEVLTEIIEKEDDTNGNAKSDSKEVDSDSDAEDMSFQSCA